MTDLLGWNVKVLWLILFVLIYIGSKVNSILNTIRKDKNNVK